MQFLSPQWLLLLLLLLLFTRAYATFVRALVVFVERAVGWLVCYFPELWTVCRRRKLCRLAGCWLAARPNRLYLRAPASRRVVNRARGLQSLSRSLALVWLCSRRALSSPTRWSQGIKRLLSRGAEVATVIFDFVFGRPSPKIICWRGTHCFCMRGACWFLKR